MGKQKQKVQPKSTIIQDVVRRPPRVLAPVKVNIVVRFFRLFKFPRVFKPSRKVLFLILIIIGMIGLVAGGFDYFKSGTTIHSDLSAFGQPIDARLSIPVYFPQNLPAGYVYNKDSKVLKTNVFYYSVTGPRSRLFHVTQQPIPESFDFAVFNKKLLTPDTFNAISGTVTAGEVGVNTIGSIKTNKNTWIIINSSAPNSVTQLETVARSLAPAR